MASTTGTRLNALLSATVGAVAAAVTIGFLQGEHTPQPAEPAHVATVHSVGAGDAALDRLERLERELAVLDRRIFPQNAPSAELAVSPSVEAEDPLPPDAEQEYAEQQAMKEDWLAGHAMEPVDPSWSRLAEQAIDLDLERLREQDWAGRGRIDFEVVDLSCRTSRCVVTVAWDSAETALANGPYLAMHDYAPGCKVTVFGPSVEQIAATTPFLQDVVFD